MRRCAPAFAAPATLSIARPLCALRSPRALFTCCAQTPPLVDVTWHSEPAPHARPLVFLPGLDGSPLPGAQLSSLAPLAYAPVLSISHNAGALDTDWDALAAAVSHVMESAGGANAVLVGESFGAALALRVAALRRERLHRLVLINSGTALERSALLAAFTRMLPLLKLDGNGRLFYRGAALFLFKGFLADDRRLDADIVPVDWWRRSVDIDRVPLETMLRRVDMLRSFSASFSDGCISRLVTAPVTLVASGRDRLLPSSQEVDRLAELIPNVEGKIILESSGHACLLETDVRLGSMLGEAEPADSQLPARGAALPGSAEIPAGVRGRRDEGESLSTEEALEIGRKWLAPWRAFARPTFDGVGNVQHALQRGNESGRAVLFVGNHGVYGIFDTSLIIDELSRLVGPSRVLRSLAHETHFVQFSEATNGRYGRFVRAIGAVPATPRNFFRLLKSGEPVLLFPGGSSEVCRRRGEKNAVQWKTSTDFIRPAVRHNTILVPFSSAGADDSVDLLLDGQEMQKLPIVGPALTKLLEANGFDPEHVMPLGTPPKPTRFKFRFHEPIFTEDVDEGDADVCAKLYQQVRDTVQSGVYDLSMDSQAEGVLPDPQHIRQQLSSNAATLLDDFLLF